jgi:hypothetical protein
MLTAYLAVKLKDKGVTDDFSNNHNDFATLRTNHRRRTKQHPCRIRIFHLEISNVSCSCDFLFLAFRWCDCGSPTVPKMVSKQLKVKSLNKELYKFKKQAFDIEAKKDGKS